MNESVAAPIFGVELHGYLDAPTVLAEIELVERLGYDAVWLGDSQLIWRELYVLLGAAATRTRRVAIGIGVTNPLTRHITVTASALVTLQELSGGRVLVGVGAGDSAVKLLAWRPARRSELAAYIDNVHALAEGLTVTAADAELRLAFGREGACPPILVAAAGPRMLELAGQVGEGVVIPHRGRALVDMLRVVHTARRSAGRADSPFRTCLSASLAMHADTTAALEAVRPHVASTLRAHVYWDMSDAAIAAKERVEVAYDMYQHMAPEATHADLVPDAIVTEFAIAGTPAECVRQVGALFATGIDELTIRPYGVLGGSRALTIERFAREVMDPVRGQLAAERVGRSRDVASF